MAEPVPTLTFESESRNLRVGEGCMWFIIAACIIVITLLPLGGDKRDPYPWKFSGVAWLLAAASIFGGVAGMNRRHGVVLDRGKGTLLSWWTFFKRRRERRIPLSMFTEILVKTWVQRASRSGFESRYYWVELRGPKQRESLLGFVEANRPEGIRRIAEYLKLPIKVENREPLRQPPSEF